MCSLGEGGRMCAACVCVDRVLLSGRVRCVCRMNVGGGGGVAPTCGRTGW